MIAAAPQVSTFVHANSASKYTCRIARTKADRVAAFRLVYENYVRQGLIEPNLYRLRVTPFHLLPTTTVFIAERLGQVEATVTLIGDAARGLPIEEIHPEIVADFRAAGIYTGEVSCLAFRRTDAADFLKVFVSLTRLMTQFARAQGMQQLLIGCIPQHARFFRRFLGFEQLGSPRPYPAVRNTTGVACGLNFAKIDRQRPACYETFFGTEIPRDELEAPEMSDGERDAFQHSVDCATAGYLVLTN